MENGWFEIGNWEWEEVKTNKEMEWPRNPIKKKE